MPIRHRIAAGAGVFAIAAAIALAGSAPASAHSGQFFTEAEIGDGPDGFATISQSDAAVTQLPELADVDANAIEIWNEAGYAIAAVGNSNDTLVLWDHTTGAVTGTHPLTLDPAFSPNSFLINVQAMDTTKGSSLPDGTILTLATVNTGFEINQSLWLSSIDPATGIVYPLVDLTGYLDELQEDEDAELYLDSLATNPLTGVTYIFIDFNDGTPQYVAVDIATDTAAAPVPLVNVEGALGEGYIQGADYTDTGVLFFYYFVFGEVEGPGSTVFANLAADITTSPAATLIGEVGDVSSGALAYDPAPMLANTGLNFVNPAIAALALLGLGGAVVVISRRRLTAAA